MAKRRLPIGMQTFRELREQDCYYVDKTAYIERMLQEGKHYFLLALRPVVAGGKPACCREVLGVHSQASQRHPVVRLSFWHCRPPCYSNPRVVVEEHHGAPLLNWSGLILVRDLIKRLGVTSAIEAGWRILRRCKWYRESDHILTLVYSLLSGGRTLADINRLREDAALGRVLGSERMPHATTVGKFLWRFGAREDPHRLALQELRETTEAIQEEAFGLLPRSRRRRATMDWDSSIHEVYGDKKEGADWAYNNTWSYGVLYGSLAETGDLLHVGLREGYRHTSYGLKAVLRERSSGYGGTFGNCGCAPTAATTARHWCASASSGRWSTSSWPSSTGT